MDKGFGGSHKNPKRICERSPHACMHACIIHMQQQQQALGCVGCNLQASILSYILVTHCLAEVVQMSFQIPHSSALSHIYCCHVAATSLSLSLSLSPTHPHTHIHKGVQASKPFGVGTTLFLFLQFHMMRPSSMLFFWKVFLQQFCALLFLFGLMIQLPD